MSGRRSAWLDLALYAEERYSWTPSYRARIDRALNVGDGDEQRVRLGSGRETLAYWSDGNCSYRGWVDADGRELDVVAVEIWS